MGKGEEKRQKKRRTGVQLGGHRRKGRRKEEIIAQQKIHPASDRNELTKKGKGEGREDEEEGGAQEKRGQEGSQKKL